MGWRVLGVYQPGVNSGIWVNIAEEVMNATRVAGLMPRAIANVPNDQSDGGGGGGMDEVGGGAYDFMYVLAL